MDTGTSIEELLNEPSSSEPEVTQEAPAEPEAPAQPRDENGRFATKGETESGSPPPVKDEPQLDHAAVIGERRRRQEAEQRLAALEREIQSLRQPPAPPPSIWEDEDAAFQHQREATLAASNYHSKLVSSQIIAAQAYDDFEEVWQPMNEWLAANPAAAQKASASLHPWGVAYKEYKRFRDIQELGATNLDELRAKIREEVMAEQRSASTPLPAPSVPPSLTTERNVGARSGPAWSGPVPLEDLLPR